MKIFINDEEYLFDDSSEMKLTHMLKKLDVNSAGLIAEVDGKVFNNNELEEAVVKDGSKVELIKVFGGG
jgi:thiamine biosynthesis protein ThiS